MKNKKVDDAIGDPKKDAIISFNKILPYQEAYGSKNIIKPPYPLYITGNSQYTSMTRHK